MRRCPPCISVVVIMALVVAAGCSNDEPAGPAEELAAIAYAGDTVAYKAVYTFSIVGPLRDAATTTVTRIERPPDSLRRLESTTGPQDASPVSVGSWLIHKDGESYACWDHGAGMDAECVRSELRRGVFGISQVDQIYSKIRDPDAFGSVRPAEAQVVAGERGRCYAARSEVVDAEPHQTPEPRYTPDRFGYEICYAPDGILLKLRMVALGPVPEGAQRHSIVLEATDVSRDVRDEDLVLPGAVRGSDEP